MAGRSLKGKEQATERDWDGSSMESISLSEYHDHTIPRSLDVEAPSSGLFQAPCYPQNDPYWYGNSGLEQSYYSSVLFQSPGSVTAVGLPSGNDENKAAYQTTMQAEQGDGSWDTQSCLSASTRTTAQASVFSLASSGRSSSGASAAPSRVSGVVMHINRQGPPNQRRELPCELQRLGCARVFHGDQMVDWIDHVERHLGGCFPPKLKCWYCEDLGLFDAKARGLDYRTNFVERMNHIHAHIVEEDMRHGIYPDGYLANFLRKRRLIDDQGYQAMLSLPGTAPANVPGDSHNQQQRTHHEHSRHRHHQDHHHHYPQQQQQQQHQQQQGPSSSRRHLPPVVEEAGSSSSSAFREKHHSDKRSGHRRRR